MFERIVVGVTKTATARDAGARAQQLSRVFGAELHVVAGFDAKGNDGAADEAERLLESMAMASGTPVRLHARAGDPATAICDVAREVGADLIVVGNKGLAGSSRWSRSVPGSVTRDAPCSVLVLDTM
jgi:nucleotide-binding universal stress UspA family protein